MSSKKSFWSRLYYNIFYYLKLYFLYLNNVVFGPSITRIYSKDTHLVVIAGDSNALGLGDYLVASFPSGFARTLARQLQKLKKTRQKWIFCNAGGFGKNSISRSWLPTNSQSGNFEKYFVQASPALVLLSFGMEDFNYGISADETFYNIKQIAGALQEKCIRVGVLTTPEIQSVDEGSSQLIAYIHSLNRLLDDWLDNERETTDSLLLSKSVPRLHSSRSFEYKNPRIYWKDKRHLNSNGYESTASDMLNFHGLVNVFLRIEYDSFKQALGL